MFKKDIFKKNPKLIRLVILGMVATIYFCAMFFFAGKFTGYIGANKDHNSKTYAIHAEEQIEQNCLPREPSPKARCIRKIIEETQEHLRDERDVEAQQHMARWALMTALISGITALVSVVGVWFVRDTLLETRRIGRAEVRAYLAIEAVKVTMIAKNNEFTVDFKITNTGQSPAFDCFACFKVNFASKISGHKHTETIKFGGCAIPNLQSGKKYKIPKNTTFGMTFPEDDVGIKLQNVKVITIEIICFYTDVFDNKQEVAEQYIIDTWEKNNSELYEEWHKPLRVKLPDSPSYGKVSISESKAWRTKMQSTVGFESPKP